MINQRNEKRPLPDGWYGMKIEKLVELKYGDSLPERVREDGEVPVYGSNGIVGRHSTAITKGQTIIIGRKGSIGEVNFSEAPCYPIDTTYYIDESYEPLNLRWFYWLLKFLNLPSLNKAAAVPGLNREDVYALTVQYPPYDVQTVLATEIDKEMMVISGIQAAAERQQEAINALPNIILRGVFGELVSSEFQTLKQEV